MGDITQLHRNELLEHLQSIQKEVMQGKITYIEMLIQRENEDYVEWDLQEAGEKSYDTQHLLSQIGILYLATHGVFNDLVEGEDED
jgi:hypothetical protein